nr:MAG TPA: hypothetical protein [Caudoviricetes sp.]
MSVENRLILLIFSVLYSNIWDVKPRQKMTLWGCL